jgi:hypothetical protein
MSLLIHAVILRCPSAARASKDDCLLALASVASGQREKCSSEPRRTLASLGGPLGI